MMGYSLGVAKGRSIAVKPDHVVVDLDELVREKPEERVRRLKREASCELPGQAAEGFKAATTVEGLTAALGSRVSPRTPQVLPKGAMYLQPTEERRRSGSHYTPRSLTEPIVKTTLRPVLEAFGARPTPEQILDLKVCDPAMGSGAFLVEACRLLADRLVAAWQAHGKSPRIPPDQDPVLHARRLVAQRCLYGVDKNPFAVDLAKLSLWLVTLAKEHPFTFLDHALRCGDSLVGLTREQIASFHWEAQTQLPIVRQVIDPAVKRADALRAELRAMGDSTDTREKRRLLDEAEDATADVRLIGDLVIAAFFGADKAKAREALRAQYARQVQDWLPRRDRAAELQGIADALRDGEKPLSPFHWEIEFPEVFAREMRGFDAIVGNPPFLGGKRTSTVFGDAYLAYLLGQHDGSHGNADLVAHFFCRAFEKLCRDGCFGLIATKTIRQGDTRTSSLLPIRRAGGSIFAATRRVRWPGQAAVVVSVVHVARGSLAPPYRLDGQEVDLITAFLVNTGPDESPRVLSSNADHGFLGIKVYGQGFLFDDADPDATPTDRMRLLLEKDPRNRARIFPYIGGEELNDSPTQVHRRYVINFGDMSESEARAWPDLYHIVEEKVKPMRLALKRKALRARWWQFGERQPALQRAIRGLPRVLAITQTSQTCAFVFLLPGVIPSHKVVVFPMDSFSSFAVLQSRIHEMWARFFASSMKDDLSYTPSDCFETFPFPHGWEGGSRLEDSGRAYYEHRAALMVANNEGLTATYNRFHDPDERDGGIVKLRELHDAWTVRCWTPTDGRTSARRASSCWTTKKRRTRRSPRRSASPGAAAGRTTSATRSWRACSR